MKIVKWVAGYGPDRSHDCLNSKAFGRKCDAVAFLAGAIYWRLSRLEYSTAYGLPDRDDTIGGRDVDRAAEIDRQRQQYESAF